uniref:Ig-like domain-containing protein n=1 Tax=Kryptolebias marmoratus TaxID=37003 RepID=A0A3Q3BS70_KRYMA
MQRKHDDLPVPFSRSHNEALNQINIPAEPGQTITLSCDAVSFRPIRVVDWSRTDQNPVNTILFQNGKPHPDILDLSYKGRVELKDRQNGDVSLILKNVTTADSGTYECHIQRGTNHSGTGVYENKLLSIIYLDVSPPPGELCQSVCLKQLPDVCC